MKKNLFLTLVALIASISTFTSCSKSETVNQAYTCNLTVSGEVTTGKDSPVSNVRIYVYRVNKDGSKTLIGTGTTNSEGAYTMTKNGIEVISGYISIEFMGNDTYNAFDTQIALSSMDYIEGDNNYFAGSASVSQNITLRTKE
ncbi:MAG: hypothetical protein PHD21_07015 [Flavobacteriales bacterium]|nr:hypothetical protein [Flavobacteriales bacterium]